MRLRRSARTICVNEGVGAWTYLVNSLSMQSMKSFPALVDVSSETQTTIFVSAKSNAGVLVSVVWIIFGATTDLRFSRSAKSQNLGRPDYTVSGSAIAPKADRYRVTTSERSAVVTRCTKRSTVRSAPAHSQVLLELSD